MATVSEEAVARSLDPRLLELIVLPTEKCNFRCTYCYEDFKIGKMRPAVIDAVKRLISSRADSLRLLTLSWFGGEPLLAADVILDIAAHAASLGGEGRLVTTGGMTTNGYLLTPELTAKLHALNHRQFQITLDGDESSHNATRKLANGRGTFDVIWKNLIALRDSDLDTHTMIRVHISKDNLDAVPRLIGRVNAELGSSDRFSIHFHRISDLGGAGGSSVREVGWDEYGAIVKALGRTASNEATSEFGLHEEGNICYAAKPNSLLIRADGRVGKCTVALNDPRNHVGDLNPDGTIDFFSERMRLWFEGFREMDGTVLGCPLPTLGKDPERIRSPREIELIAV